MTARAFLHDQLDLNDRRTADSHLGALGHTGRIDQRLPDSRQSTRICLSGHRHRPRQRGHDGHWAATTPR